MVRCDYIELDNFRKLTEANKKINEIKTTDFQSHQINTLRLVPRLLCPSTLRNTKKNCEEKMAV